MVHYNPPKVLTTIEYKGANFAYTVTGPVLSSWWQERMFSPAPTRLIFHLLLYFSSFLFSVFAPPRASCWFLAATTQLTTLHYPFLNFLPKIYQLTLLLELGLSHLFGASLLPLFPTNPPKPHTHPIRSLSLPNLISKSLSYNFLLSYNLDLRRPAKSSGLTSILPYPSLAQVFLAALDHTLLCSSQPGSLWNPLLFLFQLSGLIHNPTSYTQFQPHPGPSKQALTHTLLGSFCFSAQNKDSFSHKYPSFKLMLANMLRSLSFSLMCPKSLLAWNG